MAQSQEIGSGFIKWLSEDGQEGVILSDESAELISFDLKTTEVHSATKGERADLQIGQKVSFVIGAITKFGSWASTIVPLPIFDEAYQEAVEKANLVDRGGTGTPGGGPPPPRDV